MEGLQDMDPLTAVVRALKPLDFAERRRTVEAAMHYLGEAPVTKLDLPSNGSPEETPSNMAGIPQTAVTWAKQNNITADEIDQVFHFGANGTFDIHDAPGKTKKEKTLNTYILTGLGKWLASGEASFDDALARNFCTLIGCYDAANHASHLKDYKGPEFTGDKNKGYTLTTPGKKKGASLVKELAGGAK